MRVHWYLCHLLASVVCASCSDDLVVVDAPRALHATIRRTAYGIPHVIAKSIAGVGFGQGYASAEDHVCTIADQIVKVRSERARHFGPGDDDANIDSDFALLALGVYQTAENGLTQQSGMAGELLEGYVAGYNQYLSDVGPDGLPEECRGAAWVREIDEVDLLAHLVDLNLIGIEHRMLKGIARAQPPISSGEAAEMTLADVHLDARAASNAWAIGSALSARGGGALLANPHLPWEGELKFHEIQLTVPGQLDVYGASLLGVPGVNIGFTASVAWSHTTSASTQTTFYMLTLGDDPTHYVYEADVRAMSATPFTIRVATDAGIKELTRTLYRSHHGPIVSIDPLGWNGSMAVAMRSANVDDVSLLTHLSRMMTASDLDEFAAAQAEHGIAWANTIAAAASGEAYYVDGSRVPRLAPEAELAFKQRVTTDPIVGAFYAQGLVLLDGSTERDEWSLRGDGLYPYLVTEPPTLRRDDFVMNSNDSAWLANPATPLADLPLLYGQVGAPILPRTRRNLSLLTNRDPDGPWGSDLRISRAELEAAVLDNVSPLGLLLRDQVHERCTAAAIVQLGGEDIALEPACVALESWDLKLDQSSTGSLVWREFLGNFSLRDLATAGALFADAFDPDAPLRSPRQLTAAPAGGDPIRVALAMATKRLDQAGFDLGASLGDAQFTLRNGARRSMHGCLQLEGCLNVVGYAPTLDTTLAPHTLRRDVIHEATGLSPDGYLVTAGSSFVMAVDYAADGPHGAALMAYGESGAAASPHFADQEPLWAGKQWRPILYREEEIAKDPDLSIKQLRRP